MHRSRKLSLLIAAVVLAGLFAVACDSGTQEPDAPDTAIPLESGDAADSQATPQMAMPEGGTADIPEEFPNDVPIYPGSVPAQGRGITSEGVPMAAVKLYTTDSAEEVYEFYKDKFSGDGWTISPRENLEGKNAVSATNDGCTVTMLAAPAEDGGTTIFMITKC